MRLILLIEVFSLLAISLLIFLLVSSRFTKPSELNYQQKAELVMARYVDIPADAMTTFLDYNLSLTKKWVSSGIPVSYVFYGDWYKSKTAKEVKLTLSEQSETSKEPSAKRIEALSSVIQDQRMKDLLAKTPNGFQVENVSGSNGVEEIRVNSQGSIGLFWALNRDTLIKEFDSVKYDRYRELKQKVINNRSFLGYSYLASLLIGGFERPFSSLSVLAYYLIGTYLVVLIVSKILRVSNLIYLNLIFFASLIFTVPVLFYVYYYSAVWIFGVGN